MAKTIKEIIIMLLICLATMLILAIALYQFIPNRKAVPEITTYVATDEIQDLLADDIDTRSEEVILTYESGTGSEYSVTSSDLKNYQSTNDYVPGKSNPFAAYSPTTDGTGEGTETSGNSDNQSTGTNTNTDTNTNESEDIKTTTPSVNSQNTGTK